MTRVLVVLLLLASANARAEHWYEGKYGHSRVVHASVIAGGALIYAASETFLKADLAAVQCRWCQPDSIDVQVRNALVWHDTRGAVIASSIEGFAVAPFVGIGLIAYASTKAEGSTSGQVFDDVAPILETVVLSQLPVQAVKFGVGRQRPFVHFGVPGPHDVDDNTSFFSAHSALVFGIATSAGMVAHRRRYSIEPYVWASTMTIAVSTAYLRIAGDKHYLTDVIAGSVWGTAAGLTIPLLMRRPEGGTTVMPTGNGVALVGSF